MSHWTCFMSGLAVGPPPEITCRKHDFGEGRYVTLMVTKTHRGVGASLFGSEGSNFNETVEDVETAYTYLDLRFLSLFPHHTCVGKCDVAWRPFSLETTRVRRDRDEAVRNDLNDKEELPYRRRNLRDSLDVQLF